MTNTPDSSNTSSTPPQGYMPLAGSEREPLANAQPVGPVDPNEQMEITVYLRGPASSDLDSVISEQLQKKRPHLTRDEYKAAHSASADDMAKVEQFARDHGLTIVKSDAVGRRVILSGTAAAMSAAFATELQRFEHPGGTYRGRTGPIHIPTGLDQIVEGVFGLDDRPQAHPHLQRFDSQAPRSGSNANYVSYTPPQVAQLYNFPRHIKGGGQCVAIVELGGGYKSDDLKEYFHKLGVHQPRVTSYSVDKGQNTPAGNPDSADGEVDLDIEIVGSIAPEAHIVVYFAPNTDRGFLDAITDATFDDEHNPSVISISWGAAEAEWTPQAMQKMNKAFQVAVSLGVTVCCASGDNGSSDGVGDGKAHVDFPSSSTYALACGGTSLREANNVVTSEVVWNDDSLQSASGGGVSDVFPLPYWQSDAHVPASVNDQHSGRGVPDVSGDADPDTGYQVRVDGQDLVFGGTSAVAPLWASLIALINEHRGLPVGYLNPILYEHYERLVKSSALHDITSGNNGSYSAAPGWDACTGLGSPGGKKLIDALTEIW
jgi:kumamolisin